MEQLKEKIIQHDFAIEAMVKSIQELSETTKDSNIKLGDIAKSMGKQEVILEKLANLEGNTKDSINRVHKRIDDLEEYIKEAKKRGENGGCSSLQLLKAHEETIDAKLEANIKSNQERIDKIDGSLTWVTRTIIGALITGAIATIFILARN